MNLNPILKIMRPAQWSKNLIIFAGLVFSGNLFNAPLLYKNIAVFILFCFLSSSVYMINDIVDLEKDRNHPHKKSRPLPSGELSIAKAWTWAVVMGLFSLVAIFFVDLKAGIISLVYLVLMLAYTFLLQHIVIIDIMTIAFGFVLRVAIGTSITRVEVSPWLLVCTILLALFLALGKRRHESTLFQEMPDTSRETLKEYDPRLLDQMISVVTASTLIAYILYTISPDTIDKFKTSNLLFTIPFVIYGIFRYLYLIHRHHLGGSPESVFLRDRPLEIDILLWFLTCVTIIYII